MCLCVGHNTYMFVVRERKCVLRYAVTERRGCAEERVVERFFVLCVCRHVFLLIKIVQCRECLSDCDCVYVYIHIHTHEHMYIHAYRDKHVS